MRLDDLPRLTDDDREALNDGYVAMEGVPAGEPPRPCADCRHDLGDPMLAIGQCPRFGQRRAGVVSHCLKFVPKVAIAAAIVALAGCSLTPTQQKLAGFAAGLLIVGAIAAHDSDSGKPIAPELSDPSLPCRPQPDGGCR